MFDVGVGGTSSQTGGLPPSASSSEPLKEKAEKENDKGKEKKVASHFCLTFASKRVLLGIASAIR